MATQLQIRRGTNSQVAAFTGAEGEIVVNTTNDSIVVSDGSTAGGFEMARADLNNVSDTDLNAALTGNTVSALTITTLTLGATAITATGTELNLLDGVTATTAELNYVDGVTSAIQTQIDTKAPLASPTFTGTVTADGLTVDTSDQVIINHSADGGGIRIDSTNATNTGSLRFGDVADNYIGAVEYNHTNDSMSFYANNATRMTIDSSGAVGIGTSSPSQELHLKTTGSQVEVVLESSGQTSSIFNNTNAAFGVLDGSSERMRIDSSGNLLVGKTTADNTTAGTTIYGAVAKGAASFVRDAGNTLVLNRLTSDGEILAFRKAGSPVGSIGTEGGRLQIGLGGSGLYFYDSGPSILPWNVSSNATAGGSIDLGSSGTQFRNLYLTQSIQLGSGYNVSWGGQYADGAPTIAGSATSDLIAFYPEGATSGEAMRIDSSGNLLVGTTSTTLYDATSGGGIMLDPNGPTTIARDGTVLYVNRTSTNGDMVQFRKDGQTQGRLSGSNSYFFIAGGATGGTHSGIRFVNNASQRPCTNSGANLDNTVTWGASNSRWELGYFASGTTTTSDRNEKQDIEELSDAEQRVAVAAKGLLRKYRWQKAVTEKGDDARIHFGIIAQDLQDAFTAEGLDAARYAMWCSDTFWVDAEGETYDTQEEAPEGATEKTRLGIRYSQLLAFIISAI